MGEGVDKMTGRHNKGLNSMTQKFLSSPIRLSLQERCAHWKYMVGFDAQKTRVLRPTHSAIRTICISPPFPWHAQSNLNPSHNSEWLLVAWPKMQSLLISQMEKLRFPARTKGRTKLPQKSAAGFCFLFCAHCRTASSLSQIITQTIPFTSLASNSPAWLYSKPSMTCPTLAKAYKEINCEKGRTGLKWEPWHSEWG